MGTTWLFPLASAQLFLGRRRSPLAGSRSGQATADVDQVVGDHSQAHPALHPSEPPISASIQPVASLQHADATLTARPPLLTLAEPSSLLIAPALLAARAPIGNRNPFHSQRPDRFFVLTRVEGRIGGHQLWGPPQPLLLLLHRAHQHFPITRPLRVHFVMGDNLMLRFLHLDQLAELRWLVRFPLADNLRVRFKHAHDLFLRLRHPFHHPRLRLPHHLLHSLGHHLQLLRERLQRGSGSARQRLHFLLHPLRLMHDLPRHSQQFPILLPRRRSFPASPFCRLASAMAITFFFTLRIRFRTRRFHPSTAPSIFFIVRVSTRAPSPSKLLSVG